MSDIVNRANFDPHVGSKFLTEPGDALIALLLIETRQLGSGQRAGGAFSLIFQGPPEPLLQQATYRLRHEALGELEIFIVPVDRHDGGYLYEAVFT